MSLSRGSPLRGSVGRIIGGRGLQSHQIARKLFNSSLIIVVLTLNLIMPLFQ